MKPTLVESGLAAAMSDVAAWVDELLNRLIPESRLPEAPLFAAMRHGTLGGGKRLRPFLVMQSARLFAVHPDCALRVAAAVELVHAYSLIHDDLPAMDDADLRRGRPSVHKAFDEATAILAGDALQTLAFEVLADAETHEDARVRTQLVLELARAAGPHGMVAGQMLDLIAETSQFDLGEITRLQRLKTGAMIAFSCEAGAILGRADHPHRQSLRAYANDLGLAFQIADDLLDVEGTAMQTGKPVGRDEEQGKATFVSLMGVDRARDQARLLSEQAVRHLDIFGERADLLRQTARFVVDRRT